MKDAVLLLGGGLMQLPAIEAAGELGLTRYMADGNDRCPGRSLVEHFYHIDLRDRVGLLDVARTIPNLKGVFTAGTDFSRSVAYVAENLRLPGISEDTAIRATDKGFMRESLANAGIPVPRFAVVPDGPAKPPFAYPVIVKPVDNMGARGVVLVQDDYSFADAVKTARSLSASRRVIAEEFIPGQEYSLDALIHDGQIHITGIGERHIFFAPYFVELGHTIPANIGPEEETALTDGFSGAIAALGITNGAAKGDVFLVRDAKNTPSVIIGEIAARLSGGFMSGWTYPLATGVPLTRLGLEIAIGKAPEQHDFLPRRFHYSAERALISGPGTVMEIKLPDKLHPDVAEIFVHNKPGDHVAPPRNNVEKIANVIAVSEYSETAVTIAEDVLDRIVVRLKAGNPESDDFFFVSGWGGRYCKYRIEDNETEQSLAETINVFSALKALATSRMTIAQSSVHSLVVLPPKTVPVRIDRLIRNQVSISASELLGRLEREGIVFFSVDASREGTILFWKAFLAGGRQGVLYLSDTICNAGGAQ